MFYTPYVSLIFIITELFTNQTLSFIIYVIYYKLTDVNIITDPKIAISLLNDGKIGVLLTDTVYGLVAKADNRSAVTRLYQLKNRKNKPGTVIASNIEQLVNLGLPKNELTIASQFWPGQVSVIINLDDNFSYLHQNINSVAFRVVKDARIKKILEQTGPLITSSANHPGAPTANNILEAIEYFDDLIDFYLDDGEIVNQAPSTVVKIIDDNVQILRHGAVKLDK